MEIVVRQISGLGNQLFQYAAGKYYARRYDATMRMVLDPEKNAFSHGSPRPFLLSHFAITAPVGPLGARDRFLLTERRSVRPVSSAWKRSTGVQVFREGFSRRYEFLEDLPVAPGTGRLYLVGYWQTYRIAAAIEEELRKEFAFREPAAGENARVLEQIHASRSPVSLHVRRGDFTLAAEGNIALPMEYYRRAISTLRERVDDPTFFVFSDDVEFAKENLPRDLRTVFVQHNDHLSAHEDLRLMSHCHHHIMANSTFSWWGAWLNARPEKMVIAPKFWLKTPESYFPELMPPNWNLLPF